MLPVNLDSQEIVAQSNAHGIAIAAGPTVPSDAAKGYAPGCHYFRLSADTPARNGLYVNCGTQNNAEFRAVSQAAEGEPLLLNGEIFSGLPSSTQTITNDATVLLGAWGFVKVVTAASGVTGVILPLGTSGQEITIANLGAGTITFAEYGTSNVADGDDVVIGSLRAMKFTCIGTAWYAHTPGA